MKKSFALLSICLFLMACASAEMGRSFDTVKADKIVIGQTTEAQVVAMLGQPIRTKIKANGEKAFLYFHGFSKINAFSGGKFSTQRFAILFDKKGIVKAIDKAGFN